MATITASRQARPCPVRTLVDVTNPHIHTSWKRSSHRYSKCCKTQPTLSLRESYAEASLTATQVQKASIGSSQFAAFHGLVQIMNSQPPIVPSGDQIPPSDSRPQVSENSTVAAKDLPSRRDLKLAKNDSGTAAAPVTPVKTLSEKPLPQRPALRFGDTPEKRGLFDANDLTAMSLNDRFPPLEPTSTIEPARSNQLSPVSGSPYVTPSLLSSKQSSNSVSTGVIECGLASVKVIQPVINSETVPSIGRSGDAPSRKYVLNVSRSSRIPRRNSLLNSGQQSYGSPSRQLSLGSKVARSMLQGRQATGAPLETRDTPQRGEALSIPSLAALGPGISHEQTRTKDVLEEHITDEGALRISSKYGYNIRESFEAREAIMGHQNPRNQVNNLPRSRSNFAMTSRSSPALELNLELATPDAKSKSKKANEQDVTAYPQSSGFSRRFQEIDQVVAGQKAKPSTPLGTERPAFGQRPTPPKGQYPPRTSSLPSTPVSQQPSSSCSKTNTNVGSDRHTRPMPKKQIEEVSSSESDKVLPPNSRLSLLSRPTAASAARASFNAKINESQHSFSRIPQSRTIASLHDIRKGVKSFGKKVSKIIPGRRNIEVEAAADELLTISGNYMHGPRRQASRLLTTFNNSGMNDKIGEEIRHFIPKGDTFIEPETVDHHETEGTSKQKWIWQKSSHNVAYNAETGRYTPFDQGAGDGYDEDEDEDRPPHQRGVLSAPAHYIDIGEDEEPEVDSDTIIENDGIDASHFVDREDAIDEHSPPDQSNRTGGTGTATDGVNQFISSNAENRIDSLIAETETGVRQLLNQATSLQQSRHRNLLIEIATHLGEGVMHIRQARIETIRVTQLLEETVVLLNRHLLSLDMQQSSVTGHAP